MLLCVNCIVTLLLKYFYGFIAGMLGMFFAIYCLRLIPPTAAATLRTAQIVVAIVVQSIFSPELLETLQSLGGVLILVSTIAVIFDYRIETFLSGVCSCTSCRNEDNRFRQIGRSESSSWLDIPSRHSRIIDVTIPQPQPVRRVRVVSITLS